MTTRCTCTKRHSPPAVVTDVHHVLPRSWGGPDADTLPDGTVQRVTLCPTTHYATHALLDEYVRAAGAPPAAVLRRFTSFEQHLADVAWQHRPAHPVITSMKEPHS